MKTITLALLAGITIASTFAHAEQRFFNRKTLGTTQFTGFVDVKDIQCRPGIAPNGRNYPIYASVSIKAQKLKRVLPNGRIFSGLYRSHIQNFWMTTSIYEYDCKRFNRQMQGIETLEFQATQIIGQSDHLIFSGLAGKGRTCQRSMSDSVTLNFDELKFRGSQTFSVYGINMKYCSN